MAESRLQQLSARGQSVWIDYLSRDLLETGELKKMMDEDAVVGVTSNPTIFQKAVEGSQDYDDLFAQYRGKASAADMPEVGWPVPAVAAGRIASTRNCCPSSRQSSTSLSATTSPFAGYGNRERFYVRSAA